MRILILFLLVFFNRESIAQNVFSEWPVQVIEQESILFAGENHVAVMVHDYGESDFLVVYREDSVRKEMILVDSIQFHYSDIINTFIVQVNNEVLVAGVEVINCDIYTLGALMVINKYGVAKINSDLEKLRWNYYEKPKMLVHDNHENGSYISIGHEEHWVAIATDLEFNESYTWESPKDHHFFGLQPTNVLQKNDDVYFLIDGIPHKSSILHLDSVRYKSGQPIDQWVFEDSGNQEIIAGYKDRSIYLFSDDLSINQQLTSSHDISAIRAVNNRVLWHDEEVDDQIKWSIYEDTIMTSTLVLGEYLHHATIHLDDSDILVSGFQYCDEQNAENNCGANQFLLPIKELVQGSPNDVALVSFSYEKAVPRTCTRYYPADKYHGFELINPTLIFQNKGSEKLYQFNVGYQYSVDPIHCNYDIVIWMEVQTDLDPGKQDTFSWKSMIIPCHRKGLQNACLFAHAPNQTLDKDFSNNLACSDFILSSDDSFSNCNLTIYPNPANQEVYINGCLEIKKLRILDIHGSIVKTSENLATGMDVSEVPNGIYIMQIELRSGNRVDRKILVSH